MDAPAETDSPADRPATTSRWRRLGLGQDFNRLWLGESVSLVGTEITALALPLTAVYLLHAGPTAVGLLGTASWLPYVLFALLAGVWGDRMRRRGVLITADLTRAVLLGAIVVLALTHVLAMPTLLALAFLVGIGNVFFEVFYYSYVPALVPRATLLGANSRLQASESTAQIAGPGLGGLLVQLLTAPFALVADAASFLFSGLMLSRIRTVEPAPQVPAEKMSIAAQIWAGLHLTWTNRVLLTLVGTAAICNFTGQWITVLFPLFCVRLLHFPAGVIGLTISTGAIGSLLGAMACGRITRRLGVGQATLWTLLGECVGFLIMPFAPARSPFTIPILIAGWFIVGFTAAVSRIVAISIRQTVTPDDYLGRVNAASRWVSYGVVAIGTLAGGLLASAFGIRVSLIIAAIAMFPACGCVLISPLLHMRSVDASDTVPPAQATPPPVGAASSAPSAPPASPADQRERVLSHPPNSKDES